MVVLSCVFCVFLFKQKTAYEMLRSLVGSEMCIRDRYLTQAALSIRLGPAAGQVLVTSAGTWGHEGAAMEPFALQVLAERGIDGTEFRARELDAQMVAAADLVLAATREHRAGAVVLYPRASARVFTLREFDRLTAGVDPAGLPANVVARGRALVRQAAGRRGLAPPATAGDDDVPDPYGAPLAIFRRSAQDGDDLIRAPTEDRQRRAVRGGDIVITGGRWRGQTAPARSLPDQRPAARNDVGRQSGRVHPRRQPIELAQREDPGRRAWIQHHRARAMLASGGQDQVGGSHHLRIELTSAKLRAVDAPLGQDLERKWLHRRPLVSPGAGTGYEHLPRRRPQADAQGGLGQVLRHRRAADVAGADEQNAEPVGIRSVRFAGPRLRARPWAGHRASSRSGSTPRSSSTSTAPGRSSRGAAPVRSTIVEGTGSAHRPPSRSVSYTHLRAHETPEHLVCRLLLAHETPEHLVCRLLLANKNPEHIVCRLLLANQNTY